VTDPQLDQDAEVLRASRRLSLVSVQLTNRLLDGGALRNYDVEAVGLLLAELAGFVGTTVGVCDTVQE
jgi:hypothetical protein